jgi:DnaJ family protein C protein 13
MKESALKIITILCENTKVVTDMMRTGGYVTMLGLFVDNREENGMKARVAACSILSRMMQDSTFGGKCINLFRRFLPAMLVFEMKENVNGAAVTFDGDHESPEIIWDIDMRSKVSRYLFLLSRL